MAFEMYSSSKPGIMRQTATFVSSAACTRKRPPAPARASSALRRRRMPVSSLASAG
jgi:hypothetical protein